MDVIIKDEKVMESIGFALHMDFKSHTTEVIHYPPPSPTPLRHLAVVKSRNTTGHHNARDH